MQSFSDPYFPAFVLNTERYSASLRIQFKCGKIWTRKTPNTDNFHVVLVFNPPLGTVLFVSVTLLQIESKNPW